MSFIQNLFTSRDNNANSATYVGQLDRIWWDPVTNALYYSDGNTAGGIPVGFAGSGNGVPGGTTNSIQYNAGAGQFGGTSSLTWNGTTLEIVGNTTATNFLSDSYLYANGASIFANATLSGNVNLGNLYVEDQTIGGTNINGNIAIVPEGSGWLTVPRIDIDSLTISNTTGKMEFITPAGVDIQFTPGTLGNILTAGNVEPTANNIASVGSPDHRYTGLWLGSGNINLIDQGVGVNQEIYVDNGNVILGNSSGLYAGNLRLYDNTINLANVAANLIIGNASSNGWVQFNRAISVQTQIGQQAFSVSKNGQTNIYIPAVISNNESALNIIGSSSGNVQPRSPTFTGTMLQITGQDDTPARISIDAFGAAGAQNSYTAIASRAARGTVDTPTALQANDLMMRITNQGWTGNGVYAASIARLNFAAAENFTSNASVGTYANIQLTPIGSNVIKTVVGFNANGVNFSNALSGGTGNLGITFQDGTYQNTAYSATTTVGSATAATGISIAPTSTSATGNITITNTGVITTAGTANQVFVNGANVIAPANGAITLSLPQDIAPGSNVQFYSLTVNDLSILGNVSNVIPSVIDGPVIYVANTATSYAELDNSGLITGNAANGAYAGILYDTSGAYANTWNLSIGNSIGIYAGNVYGEAGQFLNQVHVGFANATVDFPDASIQADCDVDSYNQVVVMNHNQGANASSDFVAVANNGDDGNFYIDMGMNSNVYNNADYAVMKPNDGYLYVNGGNLVIGTQTPTNIIKFFTGGTNSTSFVRATINDSGLSVVGNINSANAISSNLVTGLTISASGNVIGTNLLALTLVSAGGNVIAQNVNTGIVSATGNVVAGNVRTGNISASGNITAAYLVTGSTVINSGISSSGNIVGANILTAGSISATGNVNGSNLVANLAIISSTLSILGNIQGGNLLTAGYISTTGNATFGNVQTTGRIAVTGNVDAGNLRTANLVFATTVSATGNINGAYFNGNGAFLTGLNAFQTVAANGTNLTANTTSGIYTITPGNNMVITGNATTVTSTFAVNNNPTFGNVSVTGNITISGNINTANTTYLSNVGNILFANTAPLPTAQPGIMEYDGRVLYFTGQDQERGIVPNQQWYVLNTDRGLTYASTTPQSLFGVGAHVSNSTRYWFRIKATISRSSGTNNTALTLGWRGTAVLTKLNYTSQGSIGAVSTPTSSTTYETTLVSGFTVQTAVTGTSNPPDSTTLVIQGMIDVGDAGAGYVEPFISWTGAGAPGSVTVSSLSYFQLFPLGITGQNTNVGNWA